MDKKRSITGYKIYLWGPALGYGFSGGPDSYNSGITVEHTLIRHGISQRLADDIMDQPTDPAAAQVRDWELVTRISHILPPAKAAAAVDIIEAEGISVRVVADWRALEAAPPLSDPERSVRILQEVLDHMGREPMLPGHKWAARIRGLLRETE